ncbi:MAG: SDR family oxidoreductase [Mycobacterium sp.]
MKLRDKVVVVTGSGGGIGAAFARRFTAEGAQVVVTDIDAAAVERVSREIGTTGLAGDITDETTIRAVADLARQPGELADDHIWDLSWQLHVMAHVRAAREVLPSMLYRGEGYLIQTASVVALATQPDKAAYSVTKHSALALAEWLAKSYGPQGIKVSCFCPGPMLTPMLLSNDFPPDHPVLTTAATPEQVADRLVHAIDEERFLILDSPLGLESLAAKAADYEKWIAGTQPEG